MQKTEMCRKHERVEGQELHTFVYYLLTDTISCGEYAFSCYGVGTEIPETGEGCFVRCITTDESRAAHLVDLMATELVTPGALQDALGMTNIG